MSNTSDNIDDDLLNDILTEESKIEHGGVVIVNREDGGLAYQEKEVSVEHCASENAKDFASW